MWLDLYKFVTTKIHVLFSLPPSHSLARGLFFLIKFFFGIDMVVAARALAELRLVSVFARIPPTHPPPPTHINLT